jgi:DNA-binding NtrC family response regulator
MSDDVTLTAARFVGPMDSPRSSEVRHPGNGISLAAWTPEGVPTTLRSLRAQAEIQAIRHALDYTGWNRKRAASILKISYRGLLYKIRHHNITRS